MRFCVQIFVYIILIYIVIIFVYKLCCIHIYYNKFMQKLIYDDEWDGTAGMLKRHVIVGGIRGKIRECGLGGN